jgi:Mor family transcriptional regulator
MLRVDTIKDIRIAHFVEGKGIREISRDYNLSRNTVRTVIRSGKIDQSAGLISIVPSLVLLLSALLNC